MDRRLRRSPPDRASAVPYGQAGENAMRFPHLSHRSAAGHKLHSTPQQDRMNLISGNSETSSRLPALAYSPRKLSKRPAPSQCGSSLRRRDHARLLTSASGGCCPVVAVPRHGSESRKRRLLAVSAHEIDRSVDGPVLRLQLRQDPDCDAGDALVAVPTAVLHAEGGCRAAAGGRPP